MKRFPVVPALLTCLTFTMASSACLDRTLGTVGQVADAASGIDSGADGGVDSGTDTSGADTDIIQPCKVEGINTIVGITDFGSPGSGASFVVPLLDGAQVFGHSTGTVFTNAPEDTELLSVGVPDGVTSQLTANDFDDLIIDAGGDGLLFERELDSGTRALIHRNAQSETILDEDAHGSAGYYVWFDGFNDVGRRLVGRDFAVWRQGGEIRYFDGSLVATAFSTDQWLGGPDGSDSGFVFATHSVKGSRIMMYREGQVQVIVDDARVNRYPVVGLERVFWNADGAIMSSLHDGSDLRQLAVGPCGAPVANGARAAFACASDPDLVTGGPGAFWTGADSLQLFDGADVVQVPTSGASILSPALSGEMVGWLSYGSEPAGGELQTGQVRVARANPDGTWVSTTVADIGAACGWCQVPEAPAQLRLEGDAAAWNYPIQDGGRVVSAVGYARLQSTCAAD